ncbi:MAG: hypothetical protein ACJ77K_08950 [Bacteroidia bacterium]
MADNRAVERATAGTHNGVIVCSLHALLFFALLFTGNVCFAQNKVQYALNDPRNPDCPCHKYQKMADDEYNKLHNVNQSNLADNNDQQLTNNDNIGTDISSHKANEVSNRTSKQVKIGSGESSAHYRKKKPGTRITKRINRARLKHSKIKKLRPDYSVCYKW